MGKNDEKLVVYDHMESVCCQKVRLVLQEKDIEYESRVVALEAGEQLDPKFLAINPRGVVPVIVHRGRTITESTIIMEYLDAAFDGPTLMPSDPFWRARRQAWARRIDDEMHMPHIATISFVIAFHKPFLQAFDTQSKLDAYLDAIPGNKHRSTMRASFASDLEGEPFRESILAYDAFLTEMDTQLAETQWLAGPNFSLADIDVLPYIWRLKNLSLEGMWARRPRVAEWLERATHRPSFKRAVVDCALPAWINLMAATGPQAAPVVEKIIATESEHAHAPLS